MSLLQRLKLCVKSKLEKLRGHKFKAAMSHKFDLPLLYICSVHVSRFHHFSDYIQKSKKNFFLNCYQGLVLPGFWSCSQGFGVKCENLFDLKWKFLFKEYFKTENKKKGSPTPFLLSFLRYLQGKNRKFQSN